MPVVRRRGESQTRPSPVHRNGSVRLTPDPAPLATAGWNRERNSPHRAKPLRGGAPGRRALRASWSTVGARVRRPAPTTSQTKHSKTGQREGQAPPLRDGWGNILRRRIGGRIWDPPLRVLRVRRRGRSQTSPTARAVSLIRPCMKKRAPGEGIPSPGARRCASDQASAYRWYKLLVWYWGSQVS